MRLTDAGLETVLVFEEGIELPQFAAFPLVDSEEGRAALGRYYRPFLELARDRQVPLVLSAPTWRANDDWGRLLGYEADDLAAVNGRAVAFVESVRDDVLQPVERGSVTIEACIGPRGDAYRPEFLMTAGGGRGLPLGPAQDSRRHRVHSGDGAHADVRRRGRRDRARGEVPRASDPHRVHGRDRRPELPNGDSLEVAILAVDNATDGAAESFMINCAHPAHFADALPEGESRLRIHGLRANASMLSHAELDEAEELDSGDSADLAERYVTLRRDLPGLEVVGGCCGTDIRHVTAICDAWLTDDAMG